MILNKILRKKYIGNTVFILDVSVLFPAILGHHY